MGRTFIRDVERALDALFGEIKKEPLRFFNEKDVHFVFHGILLGLVNPNEVKIFREYTRPKEIPRRHVDFVLEFPGEFQIGVEFGMEKITDEHERLWGGRRYFVKNNPIARTKIPIVEHMGRDVKKLEELKGVRHGFLVNYIFCISNKRSFEEFEKLIDDREKHLREVCQHSASDKTYTSILYKIIITEDDVRFLKSRLQ